MFQQIARAMGFASDTGAQLRQSAIAAAVEQQIGTFESPQAAVEFVYREMNAIPGVAALCKAQNFGITRVQPGKIPAPIQGDTQDPEFRRRVETTIYNLQDTGQCSFQSSPQKLIDFLIQTAEAMGSTGRAVRIEWRRQMGLTQDSYASLDRAPHRDVHEELPKGILRIGPDNSQGNSTILIPEFAVSPDKQRELSLFRDGDPPQNRVHLYDGELLGELVLQLRTKGEKSFFNEHLQVPEAVQRTVDNQLVVISQGWNRGTIHLSPDRSNQVGYLIFFTTPIN